MRITKDQIIAGHPALGIRTFLRRCRFCTIAPATAACDLRIGTPEAAMVLQELASLGLIEAAEHPPMDEGEAYEITNKGHAFANASATKPVLRSTAESALRQFMERLHRVNASAEYVYRVRSAVLFGSMLSDAERLGDVDIAIELSSKVDEEAEFRQWCDRRRRVAQDAGRHFGSTFDWVVWPKTEVFHLLRARARTLSLHEWNQVAQMPEVRYRILWGDPERITALIPDGRPC
jgi:predicted nucleotidyltransferase